MTQRSNQNAIRLVLWALLIVIVFMVLACSVGGFVWWRSFRTTPAYSIALLVDAAGRNDEATFDELFDTDQALDNFVSDTLGQTAGNYTALLPSSVRDQFAEVAKAQRGIIKPIIRDAIRKKITEMAGDTGKKPFFLVALATRFKTTITYDDAQAKAKIAGRDEPLELLLERSNHERWRVIAFKDDALARGIIAQIAKDLPGKLTTEGLEKLPSMPSLIPTLPQR